MNEYCPGHHLEAGLKPTLGYIKLMYQYLTKVKRLHLRVEPCYGFWCPKRYRLGEAMHCY